MTSRWSLRAKLLITFFSISLLSVVIGAISSHSASRVVTVYRSIARDNVPNLKSFIKLKSSQVQLGVYVSGLAGTRSTRAQAEKANALAEQAIQDFEAAQKDYESAAFEPGEEDLWNDYKKNNWQKLKTISLDLIRLSGTENPDDQKKRDQIYESQYESIRAGAIEAFDRLVQFQINAVDRGEKLGEQYYAQMNVMLGLITVVGFILAIGAGTLFSLSLARELRAIVSVLNQGATEVANVMTELSSASESLSSASAQQAAAIQQTAASVEEINAMVTKNAESANQSADVSTRSKTQAQEGQSEVKKVMDAMSEIQRSNQTIESETHQSHLKISEIVDMIQSIGSKTKVINDIVFQTKLLSFNASVEAARAGEHGKGFAVVAEEVGNLAQMSGNAAKEISSLLDASVSRVQEIVKQAQSKVEGLMVDANRKIEQGSQVTQECDVVLGQIVELANQLSNMVGGISTASNEQSRGIKEITKAIQELNEATHTNVLASQQTSTSASALSAQINSLKEVSEKLNGIIEGSAA